MELFNKVFEKELLEAIEKCPVSTFQKGTQLLNDDEYIKAIPLVISGDIKVIRNDQSGKEFLLYHIYSGESCIMSLTAVLNMKKSKAIAIVNQTTRAIIVSADLVRLWMERFPTWRSFVMDLYYNRLSELISLFDTVAFKNISDRVMDKLIESSKNSDNEIIVTHIQLANELGTVREVVSRVLKQLEKQGKLKVMRGKIKIISLM